ncbi:unnamed protein product [Rotaria magnacalcarata]|uniref:C-type lectin domain-containing protein n=2 Tax=Rotaria magnacalcarata TaxID=392030 RepID=A0A816NLU8_9BILA|nr:unnamed protein product [Rotaria magnacalcarata]CAF2095466.1 unnamed protein product [Rotaria magnacalcarata]CAF3741664.1 unnamed protein product [Rotaria magnacalcarata]CAF3845250.1 unnamed protein product [Rotaria magnacalcarata]
MRFSLLFLFVGLSSTYEHWFVFDQYQFPGFHTPLFTLMYSSNNKTGQQEEKKLSFALSTYERSIYIDTNIGNAAKTIKRDEQLIKLNIERADLLHNSLNHLIFIALRQETKIETYVNCKLIDSYLLYPSFSINDNDDDNNDENSSFTVENLATGIKHFDNKTDENYQQKIFEKFGCKQSGTVTNANNQTTHIGRPLIRKMQHVIEKVQRRKLRSRRHQNQKSSLEMTSDSFSIIYKPNIDRLHDSKTNFRTILNVSQFAFHIRYYPNEHLVQIRFNNENRTQFILYADKSTDRLNSRGTAEESLTNNNLSSTVILFIHITPTMITCYVNCELTDQEFIIDSLYVQNIIRQTMDKTINHQQYEDRQIMEYDRQSTLILFNKSIEQIAANFFCLKLDQKNEDLLPDKYALRKFANALDMLVNSLDGPININNHHDSISTTPATTTQSIAAVNIHSIDGFGSLIAPSLNTDMNVISNDITEYDKSCLTDQDCNSNHSFLKCQQQHCTCLARQFWSPISRRCTSCKDLSIGNRCFRLSNHKSTWYEANDYCQDENSSDDQQQYTMKLASNLNRTDIDLLRHSLVNDEDGEQLDYFYWIGATSQFDTRKLHKQNNRKKRHVPTTIFRWYDNGETAQLNVPDLWCSQREHMNIATINNNELCVSFTSCGLYADDCQRNYRFLCEAV